MGKTIGPAHALVFWFSLAALLRPGIVGCAPDVPQSARDSVTPAVLNLEQCIAESLARNPLWLSAEEEYQASLARVQKARALPQPRIDIDSDVQSRPFGFGGSKESYFGLSQTIEFPGRRALRTKIALAESREVRTDQDLLRLDLIFQVSEAFYAVLLAEEKQKYALQDLELARDFRDKADLKHSLGDIAKVEALRAAVEAAKAATAVRAAENEVLLAKARLNFLLGREKMAALEVRGDLKRPPLELDRASLVDRAQLVRPEARRIAAAQERERFRIKEAYYGYLPDFSLGLARHRLSGAPSTWDFTLSFPVPLFFWQPATGPAAEARANERALVREADHWRNVIALEVEQACLNAETARNQIDLFEKDVLGQAEEVYELFLYSFQEGEIGGLELIEARRSLLEARKSYADALFNYSLTLAELERSVGARIEGAGGHGDNSRPKEGDGDAQN